MFITERNLHCITTSACLDSNLSGQYGSGRMCQFPLIRWYYLWKLQWLTGLVLRGKLHARVFRSQPMQSVLVPILLFNVPLSTGSATTSSCMRPPCRRWTWEAAPSWTSPCRPLPRSLLDCSVFQWCAIADARGRKQQCSSWPASLPSWLLCCLWVREPRREILGRSTRSHHSSQHTAWDAAWLRCRRAVPTRSLEGVLIQIETANYTHTARTNELLERLWWWEEKQRGAGRKTIKTKKST